MSESGNISFELHQPLRDRAGGRIDPKPIRGLIERLIARWHPEQVWLFGSRARGEALRSSDWDLLVVVPDELPDREFDPLIAWQLRKEAGVTADVVLCRSAEFREDRSTVNSLPFEVANEGVLLYER